ncbi:50S ribosomal protein L4 [Nodularia spumigena CS-584]|jgi:large subunit ribosomal protein L4|uniref:Large ribosomal subunit protein uL4 n=3 Tax=Nodularia spumigena TaxID=70799 RepID=A0A2S0Q0D1_NODSP|nr:50S ribosomal protein L4 [Nodularia spumigena]AHJ30679.1 LSU ribosomal protein L4p (L1e) [Nodularia spumigena CCY9414]AVZ30236.1 50S ribosomal protein L4 [Nodularia spumigena UHCC 0039]EAW45086.1 50S ribosomal protein L4 [Nodularia spumigena CCY9414]KZL48717.1 50S ribosomal protein L4 [Nodularia spumigena CENA596]MDB9384225.1 50S ribosomal protein L4 [Nodularia spumigena CS-584]
MVESVVKNWQGEQVGETTFELRVAKESTASHIVHRALVRQMTNSRQGTASTKTRSEVRGGGRKPWRQKGTGRARAGSIRSPLWRGGGVIFGPKPRDYNQKLNRKERRLALRTAFVSRADDLIVVQDFSNELSRPKTKELVAALARWGAAPENKALLIMPIISSEDNVYLSARNIQNLKLIAADQLNVYDLLHADKIVITASALAKIQEVYSA